MLALMMKVAVPVIRIGMDRSAKCTPKTIVTQNVSVVTDLLLINALIA